MKLNLNPKYCQPGHDLLCPVCSTPTAKVVDGGYRNLANKTHVTLPTENGHYIMNMCLDCAKNLDFQDQEILDQLHKNVVKCKVGLASIHNRNKHYLDRLQEKLLVEKPLTGQVSIAKTPKEHERTLNRIKNKPLKAQRKDRKDGR